MNTLVENLTGMNALSDRVIAMDLLFAAKTGIKTYAVAVTESATPEVKQTLTKQLNENIAFHQNITQYMMSKGWYHPYNVGEQLKVDMNNAQTAMNLVR